MSLKTKNIILFAVLALIPILWITIVYNWNKGPFEKVSFEALNALRSTKKLQIKNHLLHQKTLLATSAETSTVQNALQDFNSAVQNLITRFEPTDPGIIKSHQSLSFWYRSVFLRTLDLVPKSKFNYESLVPNDPLSIYLQYHYLSLNPFNIWNFWKLEQSIIHDSYQKVHQKYHLKFRELKKRFNLQDIYLLNSSGRVLYTVNKSILFARSVHEIQSMAPELSSLFDQLKNNPTAGRVISVSFKPQISLFLKPISLFATSVLVDNDWGVLVFALDTSMLNQILYHTGKKSEEGLGKSGEIFVADADRALISSSRPNIQNSWNLESLLENESQLEQWIGFERRYLSSPAVENALQGKSGTIKHETKLGSNLVSSYSPLKVDNFNWIIVVQKEMDEALWGSEIIFFQLLLAGIAFLFFTSAVQQVMTHIFLKPIAELSREAKRLSEGGEPSNFSPERKDEIGELQASFSNMSWNLFRIQKTLESQVQTCNLTANALQDSQTILEMVLGRIPSAIFWKDSNGHFLGANHSFCKLMGLPQSSIISDKDASVIEMNEWNQGLLEKIEHDFKNLGSKEYLSIENLQSSNGDLVLSTVLMLNLEDQSGNSKGVLGLIDDLSKKTRTQDDLVAAQQLKILDSITGGITHEFRNTLHALGGFLTLIDRVKHSDLSKLSKYMGESQSLIDLATELSDKLLTINKAGNLQERTYPINETIRNALESVLVNSKTLHTVWIDPRLEAHALERLSLHQICYNLMLNAVQAMHGKGIIHVKAHLKDLSDPNEYNLPSGKYLDMLIEDQGEGIPKDLEEKIFEPFFTRKETGCGFGLPTVKTLVLKMKGGIYLQSHPGKGAIFEILLPLENISGSSFFQSKSREFLPGTGKILILDDREIVLRSTHDLLELLGYEVQIAKSISEGLQRHKEAIEQGHPFGVIILDLQIETENDGLTALKKIREVDTEVITILSTAHIDDPAYLNYKEFGFAHAIRKPHDLADLSKILWETLQNRST